jgi:hypothetical protein
MGVGLILRTPATRTRGILTRRSPHLTPPATTVPSTDTAQRAGVITTAGMPGAAMATRATLVALPVAPAGTVTVVTGTGDLTAA